MLYSGQILKQVHSWRTLAALQTAIRNMNCGSLSWLHLPHTVDVWRDTDGDCVVLVCLAHCLKSLCGDGFLLEMGVVGCLYELGLLGWGG